MLGGCERTLYLDFNALAELQEAAGVNPFERPEVLDEASPRALRLLVWACLYEEDPRPSLHEVGAWMMGDWQHVTQALTELRSKVFPDAKKVSGKRPR
jgi:hypothetical protein